MPPSLAIQAFFACLASAANYITETEPYPNHKPTNITNRPIDRVFSIVDKKKLHFYLLAASKICVRTITILQPLYLVYLYLNGNNKTTFPTYRAIPFFVLSIIGVSWRIWCYKTLNKFFTFRLQVQKDQKIIQTGPYHYLAHPSYLGVLANSICVSMAIIGPFSPWLNLLNEKTIYTINLLVYNFTTSQRSIGQVFACFAGFASFAHGLWLNQIRIADEERMMREHFGKEYDQFLSTRWRMLPFVY